MSLIFFAWSFSCRDFFNTLNYILSFLILFFSILSLLFIICFVIQSTYSRVFCFTDCIKKENVQETKPGIRREDKKNNCVFSTGRPVSVRNALIRWSAGGHISSLSAGDGERTVKREQCYSCSQDAPDPRLFNTWWLRYTDIYMVTTVTIFTCTRKSRTTALE